jgi:hypothetical protein
MDEQRHDAGCDLHIHGVTKLILHRTPLLPVPYGATIHVCGPVSIPWSGIANTIAHLRSLPFSLNLHRAVPDKELEVLILATSGATTGRSDC